ncbi:hypothetical protein JKF63_00917 [Porcisia hertigi]|uniref:Hcy-binding domain-containing protein n=1 Tax=Porcisia hertigi TaxID=2761500 RepID=A0A836I942_9TRYP|nr:hypothetical protein JKF63_00917 [Porcisia hertigi]
MEAYLTDPKHIVVLDGGLGTELEARGCNILSPLWSGKALLESPQQIQEVELAYLQAGARCITTASYQITPQSLMEHAHLTAGAAVALIEESVRIALAARERYLKENPQAAPIFVAGSVGPYGAYLADGSEYRGDYVRSAEEFKEFHRLRIAALLRAGADVLAIETQASAAEVSAIVALLEEEYPHSRAWVSFTTSSTSPAEAISDGTKWEDIIPILETSPQIIAMGVNCIPMSEASAVLAHLHTLTAMPLVVYTNSGESYDPVTKTWHPVAMSDGTSLSLAALAQEWVSHGARLVGGCCRTSPSDIAAAVRALRSAKLLM